jgi:hypothetical protein
MSPRVHVCVPESICVCVRACVRGLCARARLWTHARECTLGICVHACMPLHACLHASLAACMTLPM